MAVPVGTWICPSSTGRLGDAVATLARRGIVLLGEQHGQAEHHRWQLDTVAALFSHRPDMLLGFEMFPRRVQPVLDRWSNGGLSEANFLREVDWPQIWGFADELYPPLFHFARTHRLPMLALNIDRATNRRIAAQGLYPCRTSSGRASATLHPPLRFIATGCMSGSRSTRALVKTPAQPRERFERFVCAQQFWDRAMAEAIGGARRDRRRPLVVGIMGSGHMNMETVCHQIAALGIDDVATALPWPADAEYPMIAPPIADVLFGVAPAP